MVEDVKEGDWSKLEMDDDSAAYIDVVGKTGKKLRYYGVEYDGVWVGSNGYITFGEPDNSKKATWEEHFRMPRISLLYTNLKPNLKPGSVKYSLKPRGRPDRPPQRSGSPRPWPRWRLQRSRIRRPAR